MNERQKALIAYVLTVGKNLRGFNSTDEFCERLIRCVREDAVFIFNNAKLAFLKTARAVTEQKFGTLGTSVFDTLAGFLSIPNPANHE